MEVKVRKGDTITIVLFENQVDTPLGPQIAESSFSLSYDDLKNIVTNRRVTKQRKSTSPGTKFSRQAALVSNAVKNGVWNNGAKVDVGQAIDRLSGQFFDLTDEEKGKVTDKAFDLLTQASEIRESSQLGEILINIKELKNA